MAINKVLKTKSLSMEVKSGVDAKGVATYAKKSFPNLRVDCAAQNAYDVAEAIKAVLEQPTRAYFFNNSSKLINA